ncbi:putative leucine-rich repeat receptor-like serine/threonine-protein kinase [Dorcoceras hygrometricum]|uniref:Putative leucine-rich repeat receptor-like serine/threonine-protein kinase n=1 Tax=Dorcoceras hygrometricum TaxID=472368 RepID=A0A2Z7AH33_9LAMI|nr:putative leucine-rich repeat receptor-like serine/threonine-protein kinase [Dorcoceras hygrometricum]
MKRRCSLAPSTAEFRPAGDSELESQEKLTQGLTLAGEIHGTCFTRKLRTTAFRTSTPAQMQRLKGSTKIVKNRG